jgi:hypothetical protein
MHAFVSQSSTACLPNIRRHAIILISFLGCHSTGSAFAFLYPSDLRSLDILSPPCILSFHYFKHSELLNDVTGICIISITRFFAVVSAVFLTLFSNTCTFFIPENKGAHFTSL